MTFLQVNWVERGRHSPVFVSLFLSLCPQTVPNRP